MKRNLLYWFITSVLVSGCATMQPKIDPLVGNWDYTMRYLPSGDAEGLLVLTNDGSGYSGVLETKNGPLEISDLIIEDNQIVSGYFIGEGYQVELRGTFEGDEFKGSISAEGNEFPMVAVKLEP